MLHLWEFTKKSQTSKVVGFKTVEKDGATTWPLWNTILLRTGTRNYKSRWPCGAVFWAYQWASAPTREEDVDILVSSLTAEAVVALEERRDEIFDSPAVACAEEGACWELMITEVLWNKIYFLSRPTPFMTGASWLHDTFHRRLTTMTWMSVRVRSCVFFAQWKTDGHMLWSSLAIGGRLL